MLNNLDFSLDFSLGEMFESQASLIAILMIYSLLYLWLSFCTLSWLCEIRESDCMCYKLIMLNYTSLRILEHLVKLSFYNSNIELLFLKNIDISYLFA